MKVRNPSPFKRKLFNPCKKLLHFFKLRLGKPLFIRALQFRRSKYPPRKPRKRVLSIFYCLMPSGDMDRVLELKSFSDAGHSRAPFPSPLTPASVKMSAAIEEVVSGEEEVEDACRSFENHLVDMIIDEGKMRDLMDVEELLHCWNNLKSPVFIDLVCRFYGELCRDLFSNSPQQSAIASKTLLH
ncbi:unnamed protein product [Coffea canephora]|uniref:OVATE domain-containing protein n=2 Tax=Coffea TaxID=13442 RepID=A0A068U674_COFCA|nr:unnamed protein product [Coffea canephora]